MLIPLLNTKRTLFRKHKQFDQSEQYHQYHKINNLLAMIVDFKKNTLANIAALTKKLRRMRPKIQDKQKDMLYNNIVSDIELLRNDVLLLLKHNFYLQCKLNQQDEQLNKLEQKYADRESRLSLEMAMLRQKYEKQIQQLKFNRFMNNLEQSPLSSNYRRHSSDSREEELRISTRNKDIIYQQEIQQQHMNGETAVKLKKYEEIASYSLKKERAVSGGNRMKDQQQRQGFPVFDLKLRVEGVMSEQMTASKPSTQMIKSTNTDNFEEYDERKGHKRGYSNNEYRQKEYMEGFPKKKSEQLAQLVAQQFKISKIKENYFSKDL